MPANKPQRSQGFTLIEVLVAIAIFASLSVGAYLRILSLSLYFCF